MTIKKIVAREIRKKRPDEPKVDAEGMTDLCCVSTTELWCDKKVESWSGYNTSEILDNLGIDLDENGYDSQGRKVEIRLVRPPGGTCGVKETRYILNQKDCCEDVVEMYWDDAFNPDVCAPNSGCAVAVVGGKGSYHWTVSGVDVRFSNGAKAIDTPSNYVWIETGPDFCGTMRINVSDSCSQSASGYVRSTAGQWVLIDSGGDSPCRITGYAGGCGYSGYYEVVSDQYKIVEYHSTNSRNFDSLPAIIAWCEGQGCPANETFPCVTDVHGDCTKVCDYCGYNEVAVASYIIVPSRGQYQWMC